MKEGFLSLVGEKTRVREAMIKDAGIKVGVVAEEFYQAA